MYTLMIKTHNVTGLKYLCKTKSADPFKYPGSGTYWRRHLKEHGKDFHTEILFQSESEEEFSKECLRYSEKFNVVESKEWANLMPENGLDGGTTHHNPYWLIGFHHKEETKAQISEKMKGRPPNGSFKGKKHKEETKRKMSERRIGMKFSPEHCENIRKSQTGLKRNLTQEQRENHSSNMSGMLKRMYICSVCNKEGNAGHIARYHKKCMEIDGWNKILILKQ